MLFHNVLFFFFQCRKENTAEALPEGFFDDPEVDAKASVPSFLCSATLSAMMGSLTHLEQKWSISF